MGSIINDTQKTHPSGEAHRMMYRWIRSVHPFLHSSPFYPTIKYYALQCFWINQIHLKLPLCVGASAPLSNTWFLGPTPVNTMNGITTCRFCRAQSWPTDHATPLCSNRPHLSCSNFNHHLKLWRKVRCENIRFLTNMAISWNSTRHLGTMQKLVT